MGHKERLKQLRVSVDVLTLTATPIPRTLHMSLAGIRDMSVINQAPEGRMPVRTYVREFDDDLVREAIVRELDRDGQVYFVHNRVESIDQVADHVSRLVPYARIHVAHGQMDEHELESAMMEFYEKKHDVLVCTTIIESGLDVPNVNTIIINNSDKLGLSQLYQLRGRVGRSNRQAYAYLLYRSDQILSEIAEKRWPPSEFADLAPGSRSPCATGIRARESLGPEPQAGQRGSICTATSWGACASFGGQERKTKDFQRGVPWRLYPDDYIPPESTHRDYRRWPAVEEEASLPGGD